jgi:hypothetical protein
VDRPPDHRPRAALKVRLSAWHDGQCRRRGRSRKSRAVDRSADHPTALPAMPDAGAATETRLATRRDTRRQWVRLLAGDTTVCLRVQHWSGPPKPATGLDRGALEGVSLARASTRSWTRSCQVHSSTRSRRARPPTARRADARGGPPESPYTTARLLIARHAEAAEDRAAAEMAHALAVADSSSYDSWAEIYDTIAVLQAPRARTSGP